MSSSTNTTVTHPFRPSFIPNPTGTESPTITALIQTLSLQPHPEGGYFVETDRSSSLVPSPFPAFPISSTATADPSISQTATTGTDKASGGAESALSLPQQRPGFDPAFRNASTTIFYLLTPNSPQGSFHVNRGRTIHTLHAGRGRYVIIHADEVADSDAKDGTKRIETFVVGPDVENGEKLQWIVEGGKYKASFLLPDVEGEEEGSERGLLISETVVPGFEFWDHGFLGEGGLGSLVGEEAAGELSWLVRGVKS